MRPAHHEYTTLPPQPSEASPNPQLSPPMKEQGQFNRLKQRKVEQWKRYARLLEVLSQIVTSFFSLAMFGIMVFVLIKYETTKNTIRDGRGPWPKHTKLWPCIMLLAGAGFTLILSVFVLFAYCCCFKMTQRSWKFIVAKYALHIVSWATISFLYRYEKSLHGNNNDLWGWACAKEATALQPAFDAVLDFDSLCGVQSNSWSISLAEVAVKVIFAVGHFFLYRKTRTDEKKNLADGLGDATSDLLQNAY